MSRYLECLRRAVDALHGCQAVHAGTSRVVELYEGQTIFDGEVETFDLKGHPSAIQAFAWAYDNGTEPQYVAVLRTPPVNDPADAVKAAIASGAFK